jgi:D-lyxose ketol-isomerase
MPITVRFLAVVAPFALATTMALPSPARATDASSLEGSSTSPSSMGAIRDQQTPVLAPTGTRRDLRVGQRLNLDGGTSLILRPGGVLEIINMNGLVARSFEGATIIEDESGMVWILSGAQRVRAGRVPLTSPSSRRAVRDHRTTAPELVAPSGRQHDLRVGQRLNLDGGASLILRPGGALEYINMNGLVARTFRGATIVEDESGVIWIISSGQRVRAGVLTTRDHRTSSHDATRDHRTPAQEMLRPPDKRHDLRVGQRLNLDGGSSLILRPGGVLEIVGMNGLVARSFREATIVEDESGVVWIISGGQRVRGGVLSKGTVRDHRTTAPEMVAPTETRRDLRVDQRLNLDGGASLILRLGGALEFVNMNGLVARSFQGATIIEDESGVVWILSGAQRVRAGVLSKGTVRDHRTTAPEMVAPTETRRDLRVGQRLNLDGGKSLILRLGGILEYIEMNGLVARSFREATIVEDESGVIWIICSGQRLRAGVLQR